MVNEDKFKIILGKGIKAERKRNGMTQFQLAEAADLHENSIGHIERGEKSVTVLVLFKICSALGISLEDFFQQNQL